MDHTGSGLCAVAELGSSAVECLGSSTRLLV
jgi:hypothetical protein